MGSYIKLLFYTDAFACLNVVSTDSIELAKFTYSGVIASGYFR